MRAASGPITGHLLASATERLAAAGISTARADAEWLLADLLGVARGALHLASNHAVDPSLARRYATAVARRARREPLQRVLGWEDFRGLRLEVADGVLVPRPETESLVELALDLLPRDGRSRLLVVDVGTGSGCIACAIAGPRPDVDVVATDVCVRALTIARRNAGRLGLASRVRFVAGDLLTVVGEGRADLVVSNPPYLPTGLLPTLMPEVRDHEPRSALDGGADGLRSLVRLGAQASAVLRPGGGFVVETAGGTQAETVAELLRAGGFTDVRVHRDLPGVDRFVSGRAAGRRVSSAGSARAILPGGGFGGGRRGPLRGA